MLSDSPPERDLQWSETGIAASYKFINKLYELIIKFQSYKSKKINDYEVIENLKIIINQVSENIEAFQFNKSVAKIYEYVNILNEAISANTISEKNYEWSLKRLSVILQPFVPHISEEMWLNIKKGEDLCINQRWPEETINKKNKLKIAIQINGKTKEVIEITENLSKEEVLSFAKNSDKIKKNILDKKIIREIYVPGKIINLVV